MKAILVWVFVYWSYNGTPVYSPTVSTLVDCQRFQRAVAEINDGQGTAARGKCVQVEMLK